MAQKVNIVLVSDLSGEELKDGETVTFALDNTTYELDLSKKEADKFRGLFQEYIAVGRKVTGSKSARKSTSSKSDYDAKEVRQWAVNQGLDVPSRGRIPAEVVDQYKAAH